MLDGLYFKNSIDIQKVDSILNLLLGQIGGKRV